MQRPKFKVGDTAVGCRYFTLPDRNGMECLIIAPLRRIKAFEVGSGAYTTKPRYRVRWADGLESEAQPHTLHKPSRRRRTHNQVYECLSYIMRSARRDWKPFAFQRAQEKEVEHAR